MKEKLEFLLQSKSLSPTSLARLLDIQPSGVSHILSGRNKPSFDLVVKILRAFPDINPDWLLLDDERTYRDEVPSSHFAPTSKVSSSPEDPSLFAAPENVDNGQMVLPNKNDIETIFAASQNAHKAVERIIILYSDKTFESYTR